MLFFSLWVVVQIIAESLPISSSGHTQLLEMVFICCGYSTPLFSADYSSQVMSTILYQDALEHLLHGSALIIILCFFYSRWTFVLRNIIRCKTFLWNTSMLLIVADSITVLFFIFFKMIGTAWLPLGVGFMITVAALVSLRWCGAQPMHYSIQQKAVVLGLVQGIALLPGISRFGLTFVVGRWLGFSDRTAFEVSFLLQAPLLVVAFMHGLIMVVHGNDIVYLADPRLLLIVGGATLGAWYAFVFSYECAQQKNFWKFSYILWCSTAMWLWLTVISCAI